MCKNLDRQAYHSCSQPVYSEAYFSILCAWNVQVGQMYADTMFHYIINDKSSLLVLLEIVVGSSYKPTCPDPCTPLYTSVLYSPSAPW